MICGAFFKRLVQNIPDGTSDFLYVLLAFLLYFSLPYIHAKVKNFTNERNDKPAIEKQRKPKQHNNETTEQQRGLDQTDPLSTFFWVTYG